jgi:prepilin peptidase CpaA
MIGDGLALLACVLAVISDLRARRIPNRLTAGTGLLGLALSVAVGLTDDAMRWQAPLAAVIGGGVALLVMLPLSVRGWVGFGDTKLLAAIGLCMGFPLVLRVIACTFLAGGVTALVTAVWTRQLREVGRNLGTRTLGESGRIDEPGHGLHAMPYAVAIALGTGWAVLSRHLPHIAPF